MEIRFSFEEREIQKSVRKFVNNDLLPVRGCEIDIAGGVGRAVAAKPWLDLAQLSVKHLQIDIPGRVFGPFAPAQLHVDLENVPVDTPGKDALPVDYPVVV